MIKHLEKAELFQEEIKEGTVLVDFYADWCGPCQMLMPLIEQLEKETGVKVLKVDVDEFPEIAQNFRVMSIPTLMVFKDAKMTKREMGYMPIERLRDLVA